MKRTTSLILPALALMGTASLASAMADYVVELPPEALTGRLTVSGLGGDITIHGVDSSEFKVLAPDAEPKPPQVPGAENDSGDSGHAGLRSLLASGDDNSGLGLRIVVDGNNINIIPVRPNLPDDFELEVPRGIAIELGAVIRGDVRIDGMDGEIEVTVTQGDISVRDAKGPVVIHAVAGDVEVAFASFPAERPSSINSVNGDVSVTMPPDAKANLDLRTINGDIFTNLDVEVKERKALDYGGPKSVRALLNGGGADLKIEAINNSIVVRGAGKS